MRLLYLTTASPRPAHSGVSLRVEANWQAMRTFGEVEAIVLGCTPGPVTRAALRREGVDFFPARREAMPRRLVRQADALLRGESMLVARALSPERIERLRERIRRLRPDAVVLGDTWLTPLIRVIRPLGPAVVVDTHNVETKLYRRILAQSSGKAALRPLMFYLNMLGLERRLAEADAVWGVSASDVEHYRTVMGLRDVFVVPNAIDLSRYPPPPEREEAEPGIVFTGDFRYWPNEDAARRLIGQARQLADLGIPHRLWLVGRGPSEAMRTAAAQVPSVTITGEVPDVRPYVQGAAVFAAPLSAGSGTKFKILEAFALQRAVLTTPIGVEGMACESGRELIVAEDGDTFLNGLTQLLSDRDLRLRLGTAGREWVEAHGSMEALVASMAVALGGTLHGAARKGRGVAAPPETQAASSGYAA